MTYRAGLMAIATVIVTCSTVGCGWPDQDCELGAVGQIRKVWALEEEFSDKFGRFATSKQLETLDPSISTFSCPGGSEYRFAIALTATGYIITARPDRFGPGTRRTFYSDETKIIHQSWHPSDPASAASPQLR